MPPIPASLRELANRLPATTPDLPERAHFHTCPICGQLVDRRRLGDVIHHEMPGHKPLSS
jgi:bifunctional non-homologous end joining protein LigD